MSHEDYHNKDDDIVTTAKGMSKSHWNYVDRNLRLAIQFAHDLSKQNYEDAFVHGYMHRQEEIDELKKTVALLVKEIKGS